MARPLGLGYLVFAGVVGTVIGVAVFAPDLPRKWLGLPAKPTEEGPEPILPGDMQVSLDAKEHEAALANSIKLAQPKKPIAPVALVIPTKPTDAPKLPTDDKTAALMIEADKTYRAMQFDQAASAARKLQNVALTPAQAQRAKEIVTVAPLMKQLFQKLSERDELARGFDTNPSLVAISGGRGSAKFFEAG